MHAQLGSSVTMMRVVWCMKMLTSLFRLRNPFFALKIDTMKTHDRIEWRYLYGCLCNLGFDSSWIHSVTGCVICVRYDVCLC
jgi:hypothetical protein